MSYVNPVPGGTVGRTDQGVDISAPPGTPILAITREKLIGVINNWYNGQPYYWFQQLDARGHATGIYNYVAEQVRIKLNIGQTVNPGDQVGVVAGSGTGLELGFATRTGATLARATTGYIEGQATPAGGQYRQQVINSGVAAPRNRVRVSSLLTSGQQQFAARLTRDTGLDPNVVQAWLLAEQSGSAAQSYQQKNFNDWLNIGQTGSGNFGNSDKIWQNPISAADATAAWLRGQPSIPGYGTASPGIQAILRSVKSGPDAQIAAIQNSGWAGSGYPDLPNVYQQVRSSSSTFIIGPGSGPSGGIVRPGGGTSGGPQPTTSLLTSYDTLANQPRTAPQDVSLGGVLSAPFTWYWQQLSNSWNTFEQGVQGVEQVITGPVDFLDLLAKFLLNPFQWLRGVEFLAGVILMYLGITGSSRNRRSVLVGGSGAGTITRQIVAGTPLGRRQRLARGARAGRYEGEIEHARLEARRAARDREARRARAKRDFEQG